MTPALLPCPVWPFVDSPRSDLGKACQQCPNRAPSREAELRESLRPIRQRAQDIGAYEVVNMIDKVLGKAGL